MSQQAKHTSIAHATIRTCLFRGAKDTWPYQQARFESFGDFADALQEELLPTEAKPLPPLPDESEKDHAKRVKATLPYLAPYSLADGLHRADANVTELTLLMSDVDGCNLDALIDRMFELELAGAIYASPSDDAEGPADERRVRVIVPVSREIFPSECSHTRLAFAELVHLGPGCGADKVPSPQIGFFVGRMPGTPEREFFAFEGAPVDVDALMAATLEHEWGTASSGSDDRPAANKSPMPPIGEVEPRDEAALAALLALHLPPGKDPDRRMRLRATGKYLEERGLSEERIAALVSRIPTARDPKRSVFEAIDAARDYRRGVDHVAGWKKLYALNATAADALKRATETALMRAQRVWEDCWQRRADARSKGPANDTTNPDPMRNAGTPAADTADFAGPYILQARNDAAHILLWDGPDRGHQPVAVGALRLCIAKQKLAKPQGPIALSFETTPKTGDPKTVKLPVQTIIEQHGQPFGSAIYDFHEHASRYDAANNRVIVGYPDVCSVAAFDADVDAWLHALGGDAYPRLEAWIAACTQGHIGRLSAALVFLGPADVGKTFFACAIAGLWGVAAPPAASLLVERFNGELTRCPIVLDDEAQLFGSKKLSTKTFREVSQSVHRSIEHKGREKFPLRGALRLIVACNGITDLRFTDVGGPDVVDAVADRLCVIDTKPRATQCKEALAKLRRPDAWECDRDRVIAHMAWIAETVALPVERFIGAGGGAGDAVLAGHVGEHVELWESLQDWIDGQGGGDLWYANEGKFAADPRRLALALERAGKGWDQKRVQDGLTPFALGPYRPQITSASTRPRLWELDAARVAAAIGLDAEARKALAARVAASASPAQPRSSKGKFDAH